MGPSPDDRPAAAPAVEAAPSDEEGERPPGGPDGAAGANAGSPDDLPEAVARRLGEGAWSSGLSVADFAAGAALGLEPAAAVQGYAVVQLTRYGQGYYGRGVFGAGSTWGPPTERGVYGERWQCPHGFVSGEHRTYGFNAEQSWAEEVWESSWHLARQRMVEEAEAAGAHGVIGVVDEVRQLLGWGVTEFRMSGTAVRVPGAARPKEPFTTFLAGQRLTKLLEAGFAPVSVAAALSSVQMYGYCLTHYQMAGTAVNSWSSSGVHAIAQVNKAQRAARHVVRERIRHQLGSDSLHGAVLEQYEEEMGEGDLSIQCLMKGTRVRRYKAFDPLAEAEPVVRLG
jgi:putative heavy-metal-binding protein